jgi:hypothetical protein
MATEKHREPGGVHVNVRLPADLHPALVRLAARHERSLRREIIVALRAYVRAASLTEGTAGEEPAAAAGMAGAAVDAR